MLLFRAGRLFDIEHLLSVCVQGNEGPPIRRCAECIDGYVPVADRVYCVLLLPLFTFGLGHVRGCYLTRHLP